jgi:hypothetical protein
MMRMLPIVRTAVHRTLTMKEPAPSHFPGKAEDLIKTGEKHTTVTKLCPSRITFALPQQPTRPSVSVNPVNLRVNVLTG